VVHVGEEIAVVFAPGIGEEFIQERKVPEPEPATTMTGIIISFLEDVIEAASESVSSCQLSLAGTASR
jgi:hypothetical protein